MHDDQEMGDKMYSELHARPAIEIEAPRLVTHLAYTLSDISSGQSGSNPGLMKFIENVCNRFRITLSTQKQGGMAQAQYEEKIFQEFEQQKEGRDSVCQVILQKHMEFFTFTFVSSLDIGNLTAWSAMPDDIQAWRDGSFSPIVQVHIRIEKFDTNREICHQIKDTFSPLRQGFSVNNVYRDLIGSRVSDGGALVWTPFRKYDDGFNRVLIRNISLSKARLGRLVRRLLEFETYVIMALQNLKDAQSQIRSIREDQQQLSDILKKKSSDQDVYSALRKLAQKISSEISSSQFRFNASCAYGKLVWQRINELSEERLEGWSRIGYFLERSFRPAINTCASAIRGQNSISISVG